MFEDRQTNLEVFTSQVVIHHQKIYVQYVQSGRRKVEHSARKFERQSILPRLQSDSDPGCLDMMDLSNANFNCAIGDPWRHNFLITVVIAQGPYISISVFPSQSFMAQEAEGGSGAVVPSARRPNTAPILLQLFPSRRALWPRVLREGQPEAFPAAIYA